ncbi:MAG: NAD(P)-binding domain-containing protein [Candidatus Paceibacterota bacterium]
MSTMKQPKIGFIGQGWIGKHYADDFEKRGYQIVRYALEPEYLDNKQLIATCDIVFIAVPTPTTIKGFVDAHVRDALQSVGQGKIAVIKSTLAVGTTKALQTDYPDITILHSPEFLRERTAAYDAAYPNRNLLGIPIDNPDTLAKAKQVLEILPEAPYAKIMDSNDAELVKYAGNCFLYLKVLYMNALFNVVENTGATWETVREALVHDPRIGASHTEPVHTSGHVNDTGLKQRGAGGHCFIKDFEAFRHMYNEHVKEKRGRDFLSADFVV